jgi:hypothetical protein
VLAGAGWWEVLGTGSRWELVAAGLGVRGRWWAHVAPPDTVALARPSLARPSPLNRSADAAAPACTAVLYRRLCVELVSLFCPVYYEDRNIILLEQCDKPSLFQVGGGQWGTRWLHAALGGCMWHPVAACGARWLHVALEWLHVALGRCMWRRLHVAVAA